MSASASPSSTPADADMAPNSLMNKVIKFGPFTVTNQVFHQTPLSFAIVNLRPLLPGHVLVCPRRSVPKLSQLTRDEVCDLFLTVQRLQRTLGRVYGGSGDGSGGGGNGGGGGDFNVAVQDGRAAGQTVPHVHCHVIPRRAGDLDGREGGGDAIYEMLEGEEGDLAAQFREREGGSDRGAAAAAKGFKVEEADRKDRSEEEMREEADMLRREVEADDDDERTSGTV